jgi:mono/diheme cytochrome c family protein
VNFRRQRASWGIAALLSLVIFGVIIQLQHRQVQDRVAVQVAAKPIDGSAVFRDKGCVNCHGQSGAGTSFGPPLRDSRSLTSLPRLVTAMWNHAPRMWQEMTDKKLPYPMLSYEETSQLLTYLYISAYADNNGDAQRGKQLFQERKCVECHNQEKSNGQNGDSLLAISDANDPLSWTQDLWNHAPLMQQKLQSTGMIWPKFQPSEIRDLFAYVRQIRNVADDPPDVNGDPDHGWELFQHKGCIQCHDVMLQAGKGSNFGPARQMPPTFSEFGAAMLNHFPDMENAIESQRNQLPRFENHDVADIAVFLYSLHYLEPTGSLQVGKSVFAWRGCNQCHGDNGEGSASGPALRGRGRTYTAVRLATMLWAHGGRMYQSAQKHDQTWPTLQDSDIGHLLTFLNTSPEP